MISPKPTIGTGGKLPSIRRKPVSSSQTEWVKSAPLFDGERPLLIEPNVTGVDLIEWTGNNQDFVESQLTSHGAILFRGFDVGTADEFERFIAAACDGAVEYRYRAGPRTQVSGNIYTSTDYPPDQTIFPHNEGGFQPIFPLRIFFYCDTPPENGGQTPIGDNRALSAAIPAEVKQRFVDKGGIMYVRNYGDGIGLPWTTVFRTNDKSKVEEYCRQTGIEVQWKSNNRLRTRVVGPAVIRHPRSGEEIWFNSGTFFHITTLPPAIRDGIVNQYDEDDYANHTYYGDGSPIEQDVVDMLQECYRDQMRTFHWQRKDVLALDNVCTLHAREPFSGARKILVGMSEPTSWDDVRI